MVANRISNPKSTYRYSPLSANSIRLLRLQPHSDEHALVQGQLFEYLFVDSGKGTHLYEALSYIWGSEEKPRRVSTNEGDIYVTENLHAALLHLRDHSLDRIIWADAICINQDDIEERNRQVQIMAKIYARASRVIVWLEDAIDSRPVGNNDSADVLQEVAAARHVLIMFHSMEIDGLAFCTGLNALNLAMHDSEVQSRIRSVAYLINGASLSDRFSLDIRPLGTLVDMYHNHKAKDWRDKIYALLGMSSDIPTDLLPNYNNPWTDLFRRLIHSIVGEQASVQTWDNKQVAVIKHMGCVLGNVSSVSSTGDWDGRLDVRVRTWALSTPDWMLSYWDWTLQASANSIKENDIVCLLQGASKPTIIRSCQDYGVIVAIAVNPRDDSWQYDSPQERIFNQIYERTYETTQQQLLTTLRNILLNSATGEPAKAEWLETVADTLSLREDYTKVIEHGVIFTAGSADEETMKNILSHYGDQVTVTEEVLVAATTNKSSGIKILQLLLNQHGDQVLITEERVNSAVKNSVSGKEIIQLLLDQYRNQVPITEEVVEWAAGNRDYGNEAMQLLFDRYGDQVLITEKVVENAASNFEYGDELMQLLFDQFGGQVPITEEVVKCAASNRECGDKVMQLLFEQCGDQLLFDQYGDQVPITKGAIEEAAKNKWYGYKVMQLLFNQYRGHVTITEDAVKWAVRNKRGRIRIMQLFFDRYGDQIPITEEVVAWAAGNKYFGYEIIQLLVDRYGDQVVKWRT
ncbi:hypothetical protein M441DRAFT_82310 [Trichoderma asperellum CBS 433.97]|uniref:Heterokaryon incompatibility domain-containing protein n=1 Tax=Trichoderma asperellum (strain ATCC 204424 / CBS 433.97 / NBRC 101777) TaxID=1042311 RepID=A0A2T3YZW2_TRIA4|nr:hypothetical protein M441DRAFT_82310 [Trichoderma asperellum CBS 433.97]PTB38098.1 hypothetical protein M441DRAFT_82310 [Trichoderma asperellum CBS 433.97]